MQHFMHVACYLKDLFCRVRCDFVDWVVFLWDWDVRESLGGRRSEQDVGADVHGMRWCAFSFATIIYVCFMMSAEWTMFRYRNTRNLPRVCFLTMIVGTLSRQWASSGTTPGPQSFSLIPTSPAYCTNTQRSQIAIAKDLACCVSARPRGICSGFARSAFASVRYSSTSDRLALC